MKVRFHEQHVQEEAEKAREHEGLSPSDVYPCWYHNSDQKNSSVSCPYKKENLIHVLRI